jgi:hypothetical protein
LVAFPCGFCGVLLAVLACELPIIVLFSTAQSIAAMAPRQIGLAIVRAAGFPGVVGHPNTHLETTAIGAADSRMISASRTRSMRMSVILLSVF